MRSTANQQTPLFANSVTDCSDTTKVYVLPDGYIYGHILKAGVKPEITIESKDGGYWNYDTQTDKFQWANASGWNAKLTNRIPVTSGDQLSYQGKMQYTGNKSYVWFDANNVEITSNTINSEDTPTTLTAPDGSAYLQCASFSNTKTAVLEVKWIKCQAAAPTYQWSSTGHAFVPADYENRIIELEASIGQSNSPLKGKKIVYDGDSICESRTGNSANNGGGYAKLISENTGCVYVNQAVSGARLTSAVNGATYHSVVDNLTNLPTDGDLYCFEGGINDYWTPKTLGTFSKTDFTGTLDTNTICGALERIFRYALNTFVGKPICFVITHKIQNTAYRENSNGDTFEDYRNAMVGICEKYSIPYYDAFTNSGLNGWNSIQNTAFLTGNADSTPDGCHPNVEGYKRYYVPQLISLFESIIPKISGEIPDIPSYTNVLEEVGYTKGIYLRGGNESTDANSYTTGFIPCASGSTIYLKNITMPDEQSNGNIIGVYKADKTPITGFSITSSQTAMNPVFDSDGNLTRFYIDYGADLAYIRLSAWGIDETSVITVNEPIE